MMASTPGTKDRDSGAGQTVALVGGAALLLWLLLRGRGWGLSRRDGETDAQPDDTPAVPSGPPCHVRVDAGGIQLDDARADLPATLARCRAAGVADVTATGSAIVGAVAEVVRALQAQGVAVRASAPIWDLIDRAHPRRP
jgi:hypothetical protein